MSLHGPGHEDIIWFTYRFIVFFPIPKQSYQWSEVWKDFIVKGWNYETEEYKS